MSWARESLDNSRLFKSLKQPSLRGPSPYNPWKNANFVHKFAKRSINDRLTSWKAGLRPVFPTRYWYSSTRLVWRNETTEKISINYLRSKKRRLLIYKRLGMRTKNCWNNFRGAWRNAVRKCSLKSRRFHWPSLGQLKSLLCKQCFFGGCLWSSGYRLGLWPTKYLQ